MDLTAFPRVPLGVWPTPLDPCPRLSAALGGPRILVKRDDVNGLGAGGNKLRKLEFLLGAALRDGADTVITFGALQTNHGRQTAAACAKLGLRCELVLAASVPRDGDAYERSGNIVLDHLYGANVHRCASKADAPAVYQRLLDEAAADGRVTATFPIGGSNEVGALGYVAAAEELLTQHAGIDRIVVPASSCGTTAGLALGTALLGSRVRVDAACVSDSAAELLAESVRLAEGAAALLGVDTPALDHLHVTDRAVGEAYGVPTEGMWEALRLFARTEGIALDPVYSGKAAAALIDMVRSGEIGSDETVVFVHTGGLPSLFAYQPDLAREAGIDN